MDIIYSLVNEHQQHQPEVKSSPQASEASGCALSDERLCNVFLDLMLGSPYSPYYPEIKPITGSLLPRPPITILQQAIQKLTRQQQQASPNRNTIKRKSLVTDEYNADSVFNLALRELESRSVVGASLKTRKKLFEPVLQDVKCIETKKYEFNIKRRRALQRMLSQHVTKFWQTAQMLAKRRAKYRTQEQKAEMQAKKQRGWIRRAQQYTQAVWDRIEEAEQEEEDKMLDEDMEETCTCDKDHCECEQANECSCDRTSCKCTRAICTMSEAEQLKREADLDLSVIAAGLQQTNEHSVRKTRRKRRRVLLAAMEERALKNQPADSSSDEAVKDPPKTPPPRTLPPASELKQEKLSQLTDSVSSKEDSPSKDDEVSSLLRASLRSYQTEGFRWLRKLHNGGVAGILADEMGLGKTIQTIALLCYLASVKGIWGPHLIIVPTTLVFNWESEFQKFAPGLKVVSYCGVKKDREQKRKGWLSKFGMSVCITSYTIAIQDAQYLKRVSWYYMILDEAQNLKNSSTGRWQTLLSYNSVNRLLLTGTPLQNNLMELWSLMYFIIPEIFGKHTDWQVLFSDPLKHAIEKNDTSKKADLSKELSVVQDLYQILRPFLLRRLKRDVEAQLPRKTEFVIKCFLTRKQKRLYDEILAAHQNEDSSADTQGGAKNPYLKAMNLLMMLKKVCNHPHLINDNDSSCAEILAPSKLYVTKTFPCDWFFCQGRAISGKAPLLADILATPSSVMRNLLNIQVIRLGERTPGKAVAPAQPDQVVRQKSGEAAGCDLHFAPRRLMGSGEFLWSSKDPDTKKSSYLKARKRIRAKSNDLLELENLLVSDPYIGLLREQDDLEAARRKRAKSSIALKNHKHRSLVLGSSSGFSSPCYETISFIERELMFSKQRINASTDFISSEDIHDFLRPSFDTLFPKFRKLLNSRFRCACPRRIRPNTRDNALVFSPVVDLSESSQKRMSQQAPLCSHGMYEWLVSSKISLPSVLDIEFESGKMLELRKIVLGVVSRGERCVIFTQMTGMLDLLERWLMCVLKINYVRVDGRLRQDRRRAVINQFNHPNSNIVCLITTTRVCGVGVNLTSANNIVFYDTDWNPSMDRQAMDRCHRIGQIKDVNVYRLITYATIEENIWRKQLHKRILDQLIVDQGQFTQMNYQQTFKPADTTELIFTVNSTDDLYATRELHEPAAAVDGLETTIAEDDGSWLAEVEDVEDREALAVSKGELGNTYKLQAEEFTATDPAEKTTSSSAATAAQLDDLILTAAATADRTVGLYVDQNIGELKVSSGMRLAVSCIESAEFC